VPVPVVPVPVVPLPVVPLPVVPLPEVSVPVPEPDADPVLLPAPLEVVPVADPPPCAPDMLSVDPPPIPVEEQAATPMANRPANINFSNLTFIMKTPSVLSELKVYSTSLPRPFGWRKMLKKTYEPARKLAV